MRLLGKEVVTFWLKKTQLQCMSLAQAGAVRAKERDGGRCVLCSYIKSHGGGAIEGVSFDDRLSVAHLARRRDVFWRILGKALGDHEADPRWIFSEEGTACLRGELTTDPLHSGSGHMVVLCHDHDVAIQHVIYPKGIPQETAP